MDNIKIGSWIAPADRQVAYWVVTRFRGECWIQATNHIDEKWFWLPGLAMDGWVLLP